MDKMSCGPAGVQPVAIEEANVSTSGPADGGSSDDVRECTVRLGTLTFRPGLEMRRFVAVPEGATWGEMRIRAGPHETPK